MKCTLCHLGFHEGTTVYDMRQEDGTPNHFHVSCWYQTSQGSMGYNPHREWVYGREATHYVDLFVSRNQPS